MYRVYKKEHFQHRPKWVIPLLLDISPRNFIQEDMEGAQQQLDWVYQTISESRGFTRKNLYRLVRGDDYVALINKKDVPYLSYRIKEFQPFKYSEKTRI